MTDITKYSCINVDRQIYQKFKKFCQKNGLVVRQQMDILMEEMMEKCA